MHDEGVPETLSALVMLTQEKLGVQSIYATGKTSADCEEAKPNLLKAKPNC